MYFDFFLVIASTHNFIRLTHNKHFKTLYLYNDTSWLWKKMYPLMTSSNSYDPTHTSSILFEKRIYYISQWIIILLHLMKELILHWCMEKEEKLIMGLHDFINSVIQIGTNLTKIISHDWKPSFGKNRMMTTITSSLMKTQR